MRAEFDKERAAMDSHITSLRRQVGSDVDTIVFYLSLTAV